MAARSSQDLPGWRRATHKCLRGGDVLKFCNCVKVTIETGNIGDSKMLSLQHYQSIMEIQAAGMLIYQL